MFSYRHGFHAGNHADVLKHVTLVQCLAALIRKDKPIWFVDTHAGAGDYALDAGFAARSSEVDTGVGRLWAETSGPNACVEYLDQVRTLNPDGRLIRYPGSPRLAEQMLRTQDRLRLFEAHPTEIDVLRATFADAGRRVTVTGGDGFSGLKSVLPPPSRRALVLIDPSYEDKGDYSHVVTTMRDALRRFETGVYLIWYPRVQRREARQLPEQLQRLAAGDWLHAWLDVKTPSADRIGLHGSGVFVFNPPWQLDRQLREALPWIKERLGQDAGAGFGQDARLT